MANLRENRIELPGLGAKLAIEETVGIVFPPLWKHWTKFVIKGNEDEDIRNIIRASIELMKAVKNGITPAEIEKSILESESPQLNDFQKGCAIMVAAKFFLIKKDMKNLEKHFWGRLIPIQAKNPKEHAFLQSLPLRYVEFGFRKKFF